MLRSNEQRCLDLIAQIDALRGYPLTFTEGDVGVTIFRNGGGSHVPLAKLTVTTVARSKPVDLDVNGDPIGSRRRVLIPNPSPAERDAIADARVLKLINDGTLLDLEAVPGVNAVQATQIVAGRPYAAIDEVPPQTLGSLNSFRTTQESIDEDTVTAADVV